MESDKAQELRHARTLAKISKEELAEANAMKKGGTAMATKGKFPFALFEKSGKDKEAKGKGKEGSKKEEAFDTKQAKGMKCGGSTKKMARGGGVEVKGKTRGRMV